MAGDTGAVRVGPVERLPSLSGGKVLGMADAPPPDLDLDEAVDWTFVAEAREAACVVALWAFREREKLVPSLWTWARRRYLQRVYDEQTAEYDRLDAAIVAAREAAPGEVHEPPAVGHRCTCRYKAFRHDWHCHLHDGDQR